jgi:hypothetical protein
MSGRYGSLYDAYRLSNSSVVPLYQGSSAPEALQVGQYLQGLYDTAKGGASEVSDATDNLQSLEQDRGLQEEVRGHIQDRIGTMAQSRDWENHVDDVRTLGRYYANRSRELMAPMQQLQKYQEGLDEKDLGLTPEQKAILLARSRAGYKGLQKDNFGRFVGSFSGVAAAKNIDMPAWADNVMKNMHEFKNGQVIEYDNQKGYLVKQGNKREWVSNERVQSALDSAMSMDSNMQAYMQMEGDNAKFLGSRYSPDQIPDKTSSGTPNVYKQEAMKLANSQGISFNEAYGEVMKQAHVGNLRANASNYVRTKYAYNNSESEQGLQVMGPWWEQQKEKAGDLGIFGDAVTDVGIDLSKKYGSTSDIETAYGTATTGLDNAKTQVGITKAAVARDMKKDLSKVTDEDISKWFNDHPADQGAYKNAVNQIQANQNTIDEITAMRSDAMDLAVKKKNPGNTGGYKGLKESATTDFRKIVKDEKVSFQLGKTKVDASNIDNFEVLDGDKSYGDPGNYITLRDKTSGKQYRVQTQGNGFGGNDGFISTAENPAAYVSNKKLREIGGRFDGIDWKDTWKDAAQNVRSNSIVMPLLDKNTPDGKITKSGAYATRVAAVLRGGSGGLNITDADQNKLDESDQTDMRNRISAGDFHVSGITKRNDGRLYVKVSVTVDKSKDDPADREKTVYVAADTNLANKLAGYAQEAGVRDGDIRTYQFGLAMKPGSAYEQVLDLGTTGRLLIKDKPAITGQKNGKPTYATDSKPLYEVVNNLTGNAADALSYEVYKLDDSGSRVGTAQTFNDAFDLSAWIDNLRAEGKVTQKNNKR